VADWGLLERVEFLRGCLDDVGMTKEIHEFRLEGNATAKAGGLENVRQSEVWHKAEVGMVLE
jgi:hypothetical protein